MGKFLAQDTGIADTLKDYFSNVAQNLICLTTLNKFHLTM